jgi:SAM-dependent methyltransferase
MGTNLARAYAPARKAMARGVGALQAAFDGVWLGVLGPADLAAVDEAFYRRHGGAEAMFESREHNLSGLEEWEARIVDERFKPGSRVVVTAAGGGREVLALAERGFDVEGFEPNAALVEAGRRLIAERGAAATLERSERDGFPAAAGECDAVVVGWGSYIHIQGRAWRVAMLRAARERLGPGGVLVLSFWERPAEEGRYFRVVRAVASTVRRLRGRAPAELGDTMRDTYVHVFTRAEVEAELVEAGFEIAETHSRPYPHAVAVAPS